MITQHTWSMYYVYLRHVTETSKFCKLKRYLPVIQHSRCVYCGKLVPRNQDSWCNYHGGLMDESQRSLCMDPESVLSVILQ